MSGRFSVEAVIKAIDKFSEPLTKMRQSTKGLKRETLATFSAIDNKLKGLASRTRAATAVITGAVFGIGIAAKNILTPGIDFGRAISKAAAKFPEGIARGSKAFKELELAARAVGSATEFTSTQAAEGLNFLAKAGFTAEAAMKSLKPIVDFATSSEMDFALAADIASDALGAFGLDSKDTDKKLQGLQRVMDVMGLTANRTNTDVAQLFETVKAAGPLATSTGASIETFSAAMGILAGAGIKASDAGTAAKNIILALAGQGNQAADTFAELGIELQDSNGNLRDQLDVLDDLRAKYSEMGSYAKTETLKAIFGIRSIASASILLSSAGTNVRSFREELENAGGSSKRIAEYIRADVKGSVDSLFSAIEGVKISIFSLNEGPLKEAIDKMTDWVRANEALIAQKLGGFLLTILNNLDSIVSTLKTIGIALAVFFTINTVLRTLIGILTVVNMLAGANPIVLIIMAAVAAITLLIMNFDKVIEFMKLMWHWFKKLSGIGLIVEAFKQIKNMFGDQVDVNQHVKVQSTGGAILSTFDERISKTIEENNSTSSNTLTIKDETGRAQLENTSGSFPVSLVQTGAM